MSSCATTSGAENDGVRDRLLVHGGLVRRRRLRSSPAHDAEPNPGPVQDARWSTGRPRRPVRAPASAALAGQGRRRHHPVSLPRSCVRPSGAVHQDPRSGAHPGRGPGAPLPVGGQVRLHVGVDGRRGGCGRIADSELPVARGEALGTCEGVQPRRGGLPASERQPPGPLAHRLRPREYHRFGRDRGQRRGTHGSDGRQGARGPVDDRRPGPTDVRISRALRGERRPMADHRVPTTRLPLRRHRCSGHRHRRSRRRTRQGSGQRPCLSCNHPGDREDFALFLERGARARGGDVGSRRPGTLLRPDEAGDRRRRDGARGAAAVDGLPRRRRAEHRYRERRRTRQRQTHRRTPA